MKYEEEPGARAEITQIAQRYLKIATLVTRNRDSLDFSEHAVWKIRAALEAAYEAGRKSERHQNAIMCRSSYENGHEAGRASAQKEGAK